jgi:transposase
MWLTGGESFERVNFSKSRGKPLVDDWRVVSGIVYVLCDGLRWKDAPGGARFA